LLTTLLMGCEEPVAGPSPPPDVSVAPAYLWGIGEITLTSPAFRDIVLVPQQGRDGFYDVPNRWSNFVVTLDEDTLDSWRTDDTTIVAHYAGRSSYVRARVSGSYTLSLEIEGLPTIAHDFGLVDLHTDDYWWLPWGPMRPGHAAAVPYEWGLPLRWGAGRVIGLGLGRNWEAAAAVFDLRDGTSMMLGERRHEPYSWVTHEAVGPSTVPNRIVVDLSEGGGDTRSYHVSPTFELTDERSLQCRPADWAWYTAVEVGGGGCLAYVDYYDEGRRGFWANGVTLLAESPTLYHRTLPVFAVSPNSDLIVPASHECPGRSSDGWWVFDTIPDVAYRLPGVGCVSGADFSADGDTLFLVGQDTAADRRDMTWMLQVRRAADGEVVRSTVLEGIERLQDVLLDPVRPWIYSAGNAEGLGASGYSGPVLVVADRASLEVLAIVPGGFTWTSRRLVFGGSDGVVYSYDLYEGHSVDIAPFDTPARYPP
jgi:hypothetical protein